MKKKPRHILPVALLFSAALHLLAYGSFIAYLGWKTEASRPGEGEGAAVFIEIGLVDAKASEPFPPLAPARVPEPEPPAAPESEIEVALLSPPDSSESEDLKPAEDSFRPEEAPSAAGRAGREEITAGPAADDYLRRVRRRIEEATYYPRRARISRLEGTVRIGFLIGSDGDLRETRLLDPSPHGLFNRAAIDILERAAPFPEPVPVIEGRLISVSITFESSY